MIFSNETGFVTCDRYMQRLAGSVTYSGLTEVLVSGPRRGGLMAVPRCPV